MRLFPLKQIEKDKAAPNCLSFPKFAPLASGPNPDTTLMDTGLTWTPKVCTAMACWAVFFVALGHFLTYFGGPGIAKGLATRLLYAAIILCLTDFLAQISSKTALATISWIPTARWKSFLLAGATEAHELGRLVVARYLAPSKRPPLGSLEPGCAQNLAPILEGSNYPKVLWVPNIIAMMALGTLYYHIWVGRS